MDSDGWITVVTEPSDWLHLAPFQAANNGANVAAKR